MCHKSRFREISNFWYQSFIWDLKKFFQSLRFVCNRAHERSHRAPCDFGRKSKIWKYQLFVYISPKFIPMCQKSRFSRVSDFQYESFIWDLKKFFKSLRFVCNRAHGRSHRAPCDFDRKSKIRKYQLFVHICPKFILMCQKITIFESFWFSVWELHLRSQEIFQKSQIFLQPSSWEIPQSTLWLWQKIENRKYQLKV